MHALLLSVLLVLLRLLAGLRKAEVGFFVDVIFLLLLLMSSFCVIRLVLFTPPVRSTFSNKEAVCRDPRNQALPQGDADKQLALILLPTTSGLNNTLDNTCGVLNTILTRIILPFFNDPISEFVVSPKGLPALK